MGLWPASLTRTQARVYLHRLLAMTSDPTPAEVDELRALLTAARAERDRLEEESGRAWARLDQITGKRSYRLAAQLQRAGRAVLPTRSGSPGSAPTSPRTELLPCPQGLLVDVGPLDESARSGIARVTVELARGLAQLTDGVTLVRATKGGFVVDHRHVAEVWPAGNPAADGSARPPVLLSAAVQPGDAMSAWQRSVAQVHQAGGRYVQIVHDLIPITHPDFFPGGMRRHFPQWLEQVLSDADVVLCDSQATRRALATWVADHDVMVRAPEFGVVTLAPFLATERSAVAAGTADKGSAQVLTVGTVEPRKGVECVWAAAHDLRDHDPAVTFTVVGSPGWGCDGLIARLRASHRDPSVPFTWLERIDDETLVDLYRSADLVLQPSRAEGFGLPLAEAAALQVPILARDIPVFREIITDDRSFFASDADLVPSLLRRLCEPSLSVEAQPGWTWADTGAEVLAAVGESARTS